MIPYVTNICNSEHYRDTFLLEGAIHYSWIPTGYVLMKQMAEQTKPEIKPEPTL